MIEPRAKYCFADFFAGPGGLSVGFEMTESFVPVYAVDADEDAAKSYKENRKGLNVEVRTTKISSVSSSDVKDQAKQAGFGGVDAILAGPPCRPYSMANRSRESRWTRAQIPLEFRDLLDLIDEVGPTAVIIENVPTLAHIGDGDLLQLICEELKVNYHVETNILQAVDFGVAQYRRRLFICAVRKRIDFIGSVLQPPGNGRIWRAGDAIRDLPPVKGAGFQESEYPEKPKPSEYARLLRNGSNKLFDHQVHRPYSEEKDRFKFIDHGDCLRKAWEETRIPKELVLNTYSKGTRKKMHFNIYYRLPWNEPSCTITHVRKAVLIHPDKRQNRLLSVREAARLQSFPDGYRFYADGISGKYQQVADAVPPFVARQIATQVERILPRTPIAESETPIGQPAGYSH